MSFNFQVVNELPLQVDVAHDFAHQQMLAIFRAYAGKDARPYSHQSNVWTQVLKGESTFLVAGTAAGKTLAQAVPHFYKLLWARQPNDRKRRVLWMYPALALLEDQRRVLRGLGAAVGLDPGGIIGELRGGMTRSRLI